MLEKCSPSSQWLYERIRPRMKQSRLIGYLDILDYELAQQLNVSTQFVCQAMYDLHKNNVIRKGNNHQWYCPAVISDFMRNLSCQK